MKARCKVMFKTGEGKRTLLGVHTSRMIVLHNKRVKEGRRGIRGEKQLGLTPTHEEGRETERRLKLEKKQVSFPKLLFRTRSVHGIGTQNVPFSFWMNLLYLCEDR